KTAILMVLSGLDAKSAKEKLAKHNGFIRNALSDQ
ncbi:MAG: N-acetylmuramic acid 6-phosphate etherase, partial [Aliivibrio sp.]|nr:N-acetylmuramic acid 6-phosphate etherase [Aliivibrio sp.]